MCGLALALAACAFVCACVCVVIYTFVQTIYVQHASTRGKGEGLGRVANSRCRKALLCLGYKQLVQGVILILTFALAFTLTVCSTATRR